MIIKQYEFTDRQFTVIVDEGKLRLNLLPTEIKLKIPSADFDYSKYEEYCQKIAEQCDYNFAIRGNFRKTDIRLSDEHNKVDVTFTYKQLDSTPLSYCLLKVNSGYLLYSTCLSTYYWGSEEYLTQSVNFFNDLSETDDSFQYIKQINVSDINNQFITSNKPKYCWLVDRYLITLVENNNTVTIKAFTKINKDWLTSNLNNANFLYDMWDSFWKSKILATCWLTHQNLESGSCDWDLTDTPITIDTLFKALYEFTNWGTELDKDREASEWEKIHE